MTQFPDDLDPRLVERLISSGGGELTSKMGITFLKITAEESIATMPVEGNRQVVGILHGGAHVVLAESLGSLSAAVHGGPDRVAVGIEINASHSKSISSGLVTGTCRALSLGGRLCVHEIVMTNEDGERLSTVRMTNYLKPAPELSA